MSGARITLCTVVLGLLLHAACGRPSVDVDLQAGPVTRGLRLDARFDIRRGLVRYRVSNVGERPFGYLQRHFGDVLEVRRAGDVAWRELMRRPEAVRFVSGMGPIPRDVRTVPPGGVLPRDAFHSAIDQRRFGPGGVARPGLDVPPAAEEFTLDLLDFVWPLKAEALELRVTQMHPDWSELPGIGSFPGVRIASTVFRLDPEDLPPEIRAELDRR